METQIGPGNWFQLFFLANFVHLFLFCPEAFVLSRPLTVITHVVWPFWTFVGLLLDIHCQRCQQHFLLIYLKHVLFSTYMHIGSTCWPPTAVRTPPAQQKQTKCVARSNIVFVMSLFNVNSIINSQVYMHICIWISTCTSMYIYICLYEYMIFVYTYIYVYIYHMYLYTVHLYLVFF